MSSSNEAWMREGRGEGREGREDVEDRGGGGGEGRKKLEGSSSSLSSKIFLLLN